MIGTELPARILEISSYPPPRAGWGVRISFVRAHLEAEGHECRVLNIGPSRRIKSHHYLDVQNGRHYASQVLHHVRRGYLIHTHINGDSPKGLVLALFAQLACAALGRPCVLTFHAGPIQLLFPKSQSKRWAPLFRIVFALPRLIICNSEVVRQRILEYANRSKTIVPIPAFSRQYLSFERVPLPAETEAFVASHRPLVGAYFFFRPEFFVSSLIDALGRIAKRLPEAGFLLLGGDSQSEAMTQLIDRAGLRERVCLAGDLPHDAFLTALSHCHMVVRTPKKDGVCSSVLETLALGIPVIASENGTRPESVVTFAADDAEDLSAAVLRVWADYDTYRARVIRPALRDTIAEEAALLQAVAQGRDWRALIGAEPRT